MATDRMDTERPYCHQCVSQTGTPLAISTAFQPIVDVVGREIFAYEALVRGPAGESAAWVFEQVAGTGMHHFDQQCRVRSIENAARLGMQTRLSINFMPNAVYEPHNCIKATLRAARDTGFALDRLIFEVTEHEKVVDHAHIRRIIQAYRSFGFTTALDDYGAGHANAHQLLAIRPDILKLDLQVIRTVDEDPWRQALIGSYVEFARATGTLVIAEGVETVQEARALYRLGVTHMQGYYFARPGFESLPPVPDDLLGAVVEPTA